MTPSYGIKVSEPGFDVFTADEKNLALKSGLTLLKVLAQGSINLSGTWTEVTHNLGYIPQFLVYVKDTTLSPVGVYLATADLGTAVARADTTKLYIKQQNANQTVAYYYIFYEPAETGTAPTITETPNYGIKVSKDNVDVKTATILEQTFNSEKNSLKIADTNTTTSTASGTRTVQVAHNQVVTPGYFAFYEVNSNGNWYPVFTQEDASGFDARISAWTDATNLNIEITTTGNATVKVKYYILVDPGV